MADLKCMLAPLIEKKPFLYRFVEKVDKMEIHEVNTKEFNMKVEQLNFKFKDVTTTHEIEYASLANRLTVMEKSLEAMQAE